MLLMMMMTNAADPTLFDDLSVAADEQRSTRAALEGGAVFVGLTLELAVNVCPGGKES